MLFSWPGQVLLPAACLHGVKSPVFSAAAPLCIKALQKEYVYQQVYL